MTIDEVAALAREAGIAGMLTDVVCEWGELEKFAQLVATNEREVCNRQTNAAWQLMCEKMVFAERVACAKVCESVPAPPSCSRVEKSLWDVATGACESAIMARGES